MLRIQYTLTLLLVVATAPVQASSTTFSAAGGDPSAIQTTVDDFRDALGTLNPFEPVQNADGRRQINWDAAPAFISTPNAFPGDFFNFSAAPRARGIEFTTPGTGFLLSGDVDDSTPVRFADLNPSYEDEFQTFSEERLFTPLGSTEVWANFFSAADQTTPALTDGFGAVFTDVDTQGSTKIDFYDINGGLLQSEVVPVADKGLSFVGVKFDDNVLASVKITSGDFAVGPDDGMFGYDIVVMDDFIFGEPIGVPEPTTMTLAALGLAAVGLRRRR